MRGFGEKERVGENGKEGVEKGGEDCWGRGRRGGGGIKKTGNYAMGWGRVSRGTRGRKC